MHFGLYDPLICEIIINADADKEVQKETLCHEIIHGILIHIGRQDLYGDEVLVQALANAVNQSFEIKYMEKRKGNNNSD